MPTSPATTTSHRLLSLLSLLQIRRDWPGTLLAERLHVSARTVRRDIDRLRELGYPIRALKGPDGGYRLDAGSHLPPLLFDDEQAIALAIALRTATQTGAGIEEPAMRALATLRQVMPTRLRTRLDALEPLLTTQPPDTARHTPINTDTLLDIGAAIRSHEELRFDYRSPHETTPDQNDHQQTRQTTPPRHTQPHHLVAHHGRWYLIGRHPQHQNWRIYRADRITLRTPNGPRFTPHHLPDNDPATFLTTRFKGSDNPHTWPCNADVILNLPADQVTPYAHDAIVEPLGARRCRLRTGSWSWPGLAANLARFDTDIDVLDPPELRTAFADLARRAAKAAKAAETADPATGSVDPCP